MHKYKQLRAADLHQRCDPKQFDFETTEDLDDLTQAIGQPRAVEAVRFGIGMKREGYSIFAVGPVGASKRALRAPIFEQQGDQSWSQSPRIGATSATLSGSTSLAPYGTTG